MIVPAHNESTRILPVLEAIRASGAVNELVTVADACTDNTAEIASRFGHVVEIGAHDKGTALAAGLELVTTPAVVLIDADLKGLAPEHVTALATRGPSNGMLVGIRGLTPWGTRVPTIVGALPSISGERRVPTAFARRLRLDGAGWRSETLINAAAARARLPRAHIMLWGVSNTSKVARTPLGWAVELAKVGLVNLELAPELARYAAGLN